MMNVTVIKQIAFRPIALFMAFAMAASALGSCSARRFVPTPEELPTDVHGLYLQLDLEDGDEAGGEIIAVTEDRLFLLDQYVDTVRVFSRGDITGTTIHASRLFDVPGSSAAVVLAILIGITLAQGYFTFLTFPITLVAGALNNAAIMRSDYVIEHVLWTDLHKYARFPQGLPPALELRDIHAGPTG